MQSMTGYGRARACRDGREITIELTVFWTFPSGCPKI